MKKNNMKIDVIISYLSLIISVFITFFLTKYQLKYLGKEQFGIFNLIASVIGYINILDLGIGQTVIRYVSLYKAQNDIESVERLYGYSLKNYIKISFVGIIIGILIYLNSSFIFPNLSSNEMYLFKVCFLISLLNVVLQISGAAFNAILSGYSKFKFIRLTNLFKNAFRALLIILLLKMGFNIISIFVIDLILNQALNLMNFFYIKNKLKLKLRFHNIEKTLKKELSSYSFFVFLGIITDQIFWRTDNIILGIMSTTAVVGVYSISSQLVNQYLTICATFSSVFLPAITEMTTLKDAKEKLNKFFINASRYQFILVLIILINYIFLGKEFITLWIGSDYIDVYYLGLIIFSSLTVPMFQTTGYQILYAMKKHKVRSILYVFNAVVNIIMSIIFFKYFGAYGPALATALAMFIGNTVLINIYYKKALGLKLLNFFNQVCSKTLASGVLVACAFLILNKFMVNITWIDFLTKATLANTLFLILIFIIVLTKEEKNKVSRLVKVVIKK